MRKSIDISRISVLEAKSARELPLLTQRYTEDGGLENAVALFSNKYGYEPQTVWLWAKTYCIPIDQNRTGVLLISG